MAAPQFFNTDFNTLFAAAKADLETRLGRALQPASVEYQILIAIVFREQLFRERAQYATTQNLVSFAEAGSLDALGTLLGVERTGALAASCTLRITLVTGHGGVTIPSGTRVQTTDGQVVFAVDSDRVVLAGTNTVDISATANITGSVGNGYIPGDVNTIIDTLSFITAAQNINQTAGGADVETDSQLRERIKLATAQFSTAGSRESYEFWTRSANPNIIDVAAINSAPGEVSVFPLLSDGSITPAQVLNQVSAVLTDEAVRPLTDTVIVAAPTRLTYNLNVELTLFNTADVSDTEAAVLAALNEYAVAQRQSLGRDVNEDQITRVAMIDGVYSVEFVGFSDLVVGETEYSFLSSISVTTVNQVVG